MSDYNAESRRLTKKLAASVSKKLASSGRTLARDATTGRYVIKSLGGESVTTPRTRPNPSSEIAVQRAKLGAHYLRPTRTDAPTQSNASSGSAPTRKRSSVTVREQQPNSQTVKKESAGKRAGGLRSSRAGRMVKKSSHTR